MWFITLETDVLSLSACLKRTDVLLVHPACLSFWMAVTLGNLCASCTAAGPCFPPAMAG